MILTVIYAMLSIGGICNPSDLKKSDMPEDLKRSSQAALGLPLTLNDVFTVSSSIE